MKSLSSINFSGNYGKVISFFFFFQDSKLSFFIFLFFIIIIIFIFPLYSKGVRLSLHVYITITFFPPWQGNFCEEGP